MSSPATVGVAIMAKAPDAGAVKTRLCPPLSPREAAALARGFLRDRIAQVRDVTGASPVIAYTPASERDLFERLAPDFALITLRRARAANLRTACVSPWFDVDTPDDLTRLCAALTESPHVAPATSRVIPGRAACRLRGETSRP